MLESIPLNNVDEQEEPKWTDYAIFCIFGTGMSFGIGIIIYFHFF